MPRSPKVYIDVNVDFDQNGRMLPRVLTREDGTRYEIDRVKSIKPSFAAKAGGQGDRYTVMVAGQERYLYFEHNSNCYDQNIGRWFIERKG